MITIRKNTLMMVWDIPWPIGQRHTVWNDGVTHNACIVPET